MNANARAAGVRWALTDLYDGVDDPRIRQDLEHALASAREFAQRYRGRINAPGGPAPEIVAAATAEIERIFEAGGKACVYAELLHAADATPESHGALVAFTQEQASAIRQEMLFFELEWLAVDESAAVRVTTDSACRRFRHYLEALRRYQPHVLSEPEEKILEETANTGARAFTRLFDEVLAGMRFAVDVEGERRQLTESEVLTLLYDNRQTVRRDAAAGLTAGLQSSQLLLGFVFNTLVQDHATEDRLRHYAHPMHSRHLANEIATETVEALMKACEARHDVVQRYYRLKGRLLGITPLADYDRYAPVSAASEAVAWAACREIVSAAYEAFSPRMAEIADQFFDRRWIDAELRPGKRGGAFCASTVPSLHPYVLVNYTDQIHDVMTVAHELGHGVHQYLARRQGYLQADSPLTMAETASVFGEMLVFNHLLNRAQTPQARLALLSRKIEDIIGTVFRQITLTRFEQQLHTARRTRGELSREAICDLWTGANSDLYGDSVTLSDGYRWWWAYIPHFIHTPFYCYAYGFGELLVLALYQIYRRDGTAFVPKYLDLLAAGGSDSPENLLRPLGVNIADPGFWGLGLEPFREMVDEAEELAANQIATV